MSPAASRIDAARFEVVAKTCRWSERSLSVARALLVDGLPLSEVAAANQVTPAYANVLRTRFLDKDEKERLKAFMQREKPAEKSLEPFRTGIAALQERGYSVEQIIAFLKENGVTTTAAKVQKFLRSIA